MTGRKLIQKICDHCCELDEEVKLYLFERDENGDVTSKKEISVYNIINGKIYVEMCSAKDCPHGF